VGGWGGEPGSEQGGPRAERTHVEAEPVARRAEQHAAAHLLLHVRLEALLKVLGAKLAGSLAAASMRAWIVAGSSLASARTPEQPEQIDPPQVGRRVRGSSTPSCSNIAMRLDRCHTQRTQGSKTATRSPRATERLVVLAMATTESEERGGG